MILPPNMPTSPSPHPRATLYTHLGQLLALTKPRVTLLAVFCAMIGMLLAGEGQVPPVTFALASTGIALMAGGAFTINCLLERHIDARMARTQHRPMPQGHIGIWQAGIFGLSIVSLGAWLLYEWVNPLSMWLTLATFLGYAIVYTVILKPITPQNIVIGGLSGAMPPLLGWVAITNHIAPQAWLLVLIIFVWTPPHFWALALYREADYRNSGLPMLPVTHGGHFTRLHILLYTILLAAVSVLPFAIQMSGWLYLIGVILLNIRFIRLALKLHHQYEEKLARQTFQFSLWYLSGLFALLLLDLYIPIIG